MIRVAGDAVRGQRGRIPLSVLVVALIMASCGGSPPRQTSVQKVPSSPLALQSGIPSEPPSPLATPRLCGANANTVTIHASRPTLTYLRICGQASVRGKGAFHLDIFRAGEDQPVFSPTILTGDAGQQVKFTVRNQSPASHTFSLDEENIDEVIAPGKAVRVTVTFPKKGALFFYCRYHEFLGQGGELKAGD